MDQLIHPYLSNAISLLYTPESFSFQTSQELLMSVLSRPVPSSPDHHDNDDHDGDDDHIDHDEHDDHGDQEVGG